MEASEAAPIMVGGEAGVAVGGWLRWTPGPEWPPAGGEAGLLAQQC